MKKMSLLLIVAIVAATSASAAEKKPWEMTYEEAMAQNAKSWRLVKEGAPLVLPTWALPFYFSYKNAEKAQQGGQKKK
jgi:hypothetical protein